MKILKDEKNNLIWQCFSSDEDRTPEEETIFYDKIEELNSWDKYGNYGIERYIKGEETSLSFGDLLNAYLIFAREPRNLLVCHLPENPAQDGTCNNPQSQQILGVCLIQTKQTLSHKDYLKNYIKHCIESKKMSSTPKDITVIDAIKALTNEDGSNNLSIDIFAINPKFQHKGFGTMALKSIIENINEFSNEEKLNTITTSINNENTPSIKTFAQNGFKLFYDPTQCTCDYMLSEPLEPNA